MTIKKILGAIKKADEDFELIQENDCIAIGVSGGKDSTLLLLAMAEYQKLCKLAYNKHFKVIGIHISMGFDGMNFTEYDQFFKEKNIELHHIPSQIYDILKLHLKEDKLQCSLCSKLKKGAVIKAAKELQCNKVAFAHHSDDAIETLIMNAIYGGRLATFDPKMYLTDSQVTFIRPFSYLCEQDIRNACQHLNIPIVKSTCPNDGFTKRQDAKEMLQYIYKHYPSAKKNLVKALTNQKQVHLWNITGNQEE